MAKKFFYVCAGLFLLIASYQLGVRSAQAQGGGDRVAAVRDGGSVITEDGDYYGYSGSGPYVFWLNVFESAGHPLASGDRVVGVQGTWVYTAYGDYFENPYGYGFVYRGNVFSGAPTSSTKRSWGSLKVGDR